MILGKFFGKVVKKSGPRASLSRTWLQVEPLQPGFRSIDRGHVAMTSPCNQPMDQANSEDLQKKKSQVPWHGI